MNFTTLLPRQKALYHPYAAATNRAYPGRLPRPYQLLPDGAFAPNPAPRLWARQHQRSARSYTNLILLLAIIISLAMCVLAAANRNAAASGLLLPGAGRRVSMRLRLRGSGLARAWYERGAFPPASTLAVIKDAAEAEADGQRREQDGIMAARTATNADDVAVPAKADLVSLLPTDAPTALPEAVPETVPADPASATAGNIAEAAAAESTADERAAAEQAALDAQAALEAKPVQAAAAEQPPPAADAAADAAVSTEPPAVHDVAAGAEGGKAAEGGAVGSDGAAQVAAAAAAQPPPTDSVLTAAAAAAAAAKAAEQAKAAERERAIKEVNRPFDADFDDDFEDEDEPAPTRPPRRGGLRRRRSRADIIAFEDDEGE